MCFNQIYHEVIEGYGEFVGVLPNDVHQVFSAEVVEVVGSFDVVYFVLKGLHLRKQFV